MISNEKKVEKRWKKPLFFDIENSLWKYNLGTFWEPGIRTWCMFNLAKNWTNFDPPKHELNNLTDVRLCMTFTIVYLFYIELNS